MEDPNRPVYLHVAGFFEEISIFSTYNGTTPSASVFKIPDNCISIKPTFTTSKHPSKGSFEA